MELTDQYLTIKDSGEGLYKEKGSKFISLAIFVQDEDEVKERLLEIKKRFYDARHHCYAYRLSLESDQFRSNDDGEPSGSAGKPILNQIYSYEMFHVLVVVVRYFGGTKLGVSGLVSAYKTAAREALENAVFEMRFITGIFRITCDYPMVDQVMRMIKEEDLKVLKQQFELNCKLEVEVKKSQQEKFLSRIGLWYDVDVKEL
jgi:uncharacterized YigZ family protein